MSCIEVINTFRVQKIKTLSLITACLFIFFSNMSKASSDNLYDFLWLDPDKKVYVLQNKVYEKKGRTYFNIGYSKTLTSNFYDTSAIHLLAGHYLTEEWSIELFYQTYSNSTNSDYENLVEVNGVVPFTRKINSSYGAMALWSPFYGKINTFNKIFYFDWSIGLGVGQIEAQSNALTVTDTTKSDVFNDEKYTSGVIKTGVRFHANENMHIGIDYKRTQYRAPGVKFEDRPQEKSWRANNEVLFSIGLSF